MDSFPVLAPRGSTETAATEPRRVPTWRRLRNSSSAGAPTRERILHAAAQLFAEHGFAGTSMPAIAARSGITAGAIYRHFASKAALLLEVVKRALEALPFSFERGGDEQDVALLPEVAARLTEPTLSLLRQLSLEVHAAARRDPEVSQLLAAYNEAALQRIRALVESARYSGTRGAPRDPELTARALMVFLMGLHHMDTLHPQLVGDQAWRDFVASHVAVILGLSARAERGPSVRERAPEQGANPVVGGENERER